MKTEFTEEEKRIMLIGAICGGKRPPMPIYARDVLMGTEKELTEHTKEEIVLNQNIQNGKHE